MKKILFLILAAMLLIAAVVPAQTIKLVKDIDPTGSSYPHDFVGLRTGMLPDMQYNLLFGADDGTHGRELWITDGTPAGTRMLKDIDASGASDVHNLTRSGTLLSPKVFFTAIDRVHGGELWITSGTEASTRMVADINPGSNFAYPDNLTPYNGDILFLAYDSTHGRELYISDGTEAGTRLLKDIYPGPGSSGINNLTVIEGRGWFSASDGEHGWELWLTGGTSVNTQMLKNINTQSGGAGSYPTYFTSFKGKVYFSANDGDHGDQLYVSDGTTSGTMMVTQMENLSGAIRYLTVFGEYLYFYRYASSTGGIMYRTDGTEEGTKEFPTMQEKEDANNKPRIVMNNRLYFVMWTAANGLELWSTDGTESGTSLVRDINPGPANSDPSYKGIAVMNNLLYFSAVNNDDQNCQVWVTDGTTAGTRMIVPDVAPMELPLGYTMEFYVWNEILYFTASYTSHEVELWKILPPATGMEEITIAPPEFETWPNPARGELHVNCSHPVTLRIFDFSGRILTEKIFPQSGTLSLAGLAPGLYFIADKENKTVRKLVVE